MRGFDAKFFENLFEDIVKKGKDTSKMIEDATEKAKEKLSPTTITLTKGISLESFVESDLEEFHKADASQKVKELATIHTAITNWVTKMITRLKAHVELNRQAISDLFSLLNSTGAKVQELMDEIDRLEAEKKELVTRHAKEHEELAKEHEVLAKEHEELANKLAKEQEELAKKLVKEQEELATKLAKEQAELVTKVEKEKEELDEVHQRGLKGNLLVSTSTRQTKQGRPVPRVPRVATTKQGQRGKEGDLEYVTRLIKLKSKNTININPNQVAACHGVGPQRDGDWDTFVISFWDRTSYSSWDYLTTAMMTGKVDGALTMDHKVNVFLNYQLTRPRAALAKAARQARLANHIEKECITQNGEVKVKEFRGAWRKVSTVAEVEAIRAPLRLH